jgi:DNA-binding NarL/FixJ family response regulator
MPERSAAYHLDRRLPATCLLITPSVQLASSVHGTLTRGIGSRVWIWQEAALEPALRVLRACEFRLILFDLTLADARPGSALRALRRHAPRTPLALLAAGVETPLRLERKGMGDERARLAGAAAVVPQADLAALERAVRRILGMPPERG